uniref:Uncharacterized protein n=1 Tax=Cacopsylla melanoneura TaxID=428564 RepID=A0A8D8SI37_9HEMI
MPLCLPCTTTDNVSCHCVCPVLLLILCHATVFALYPVLLLILSCHCVCLVLLLIMFLYFLTLKRYRNMKDKIPSVIIEGNSLGQQFLQISLLGCKYFPIELDVFIMF